MKQSKKMPHTESPIEQSTYDPSRRVAIKRLAAGAGALAAYHTMPTNWTTPIIDQIFLPI